MNVCKNVDGPIQAWGYGIKVFQPQGTANLCLSHIKTAEKHNYSGDFHTGKTSTTTIIKIEGLNSLEKAHLKHLANHGWKAVGVNGEYGRLNEFDLLCNEIGIESFCLWHIGKEKHGRGIFLYHLTRTSKNRIKL